MDQFDNPSHGEVGSLGLDIGTRACKYILAERSADRIEIEGAGAIDLPNDLVREGIVTDRKSLSRILSGQLEHIPASQADVVFSIPSRLATLRWVSLPPMPPDELREAARYRVKRHLPFPVDEAYVEACPPDTEGDTPGPSLVIAVPKAVVESRAEAIAQAGLRPIRAELEAQAILRVMERSLNERSALWRDASMTIIDVGGHNTHMYVVQNQRLQFIRGVKFGSELFVRAVSSGMEISLPEAEQVLNDPLTRLDSEGTLISAHGDEIKRTVLEADLQKLTREFLRLLRYFRSLHPERSYAGILDHVMISGGLVGLQGFGEYLEQTLGLRVERARPIAGMTAKVNPEAFQRIASRQEAFTVVMGLALSGICRKSGSVGDEYAGNEFAWTRAS